MAVETTQREDTTPPTDLQAPDAWWRAANYLSVGQIYLMDDPLLREPLRPEHVKPRLLGVQQTALRQFMLDERLRCRRHTRQFGEDAPDVADWVWPG